MDEITRTQRKTQAYWFADGIAELVGGAVLAALGILLYASTLRPEQIYSTIALMVMIVGFPLSAKAVRVVKDRVTHERTGDVRYPESSGRRRGLGAVLAAALGAGFAFYATTTGNITFEGVPGTIMLVCLGAGVTISLVVRAYRLELPRFYINAAVAGLASTAAILLEIGFIAGMGVIWTALGIASILTGSTVFAEYLTQNPETEADAL